MSAYFYAGIDTVLLGEPISIKITEVGGGGLSKTVALNGRYFHVHELSSVYAGVDWFSLASELLTALNSGGLSATYSLAFSQAAATYTISASGGGVTSFGIDLDNATTEHVLGMAATVSGALSYTSTARPYYVINGTEACITEWSELREVDDDIQTDLIAWDGSFIEGLSRPGAARDFVFEVPWEPRSAIWADEATAAVPWTWQHWFPHLRTGVPFIVEVAGLFPTARASMAAVPSKSRSAFRPKLLGGDYLAHASIPIAGYYIGAAQV